MTDITDNLVAFPGVNQTPPSAQHQSQEIPATPLIQTDMRGLCIDFIRLMNKPGGSRARRACGGGDIGNSPRLRHQDHHSRRGI